MPIKSELHRRFVKAVKVRRQELEMTQGELAKKLGVQQPVVAAMEAGANCPTLAIVERVAAALNIQPEALMLTPVGSDSKK
ncbi:MAG: helix-turn-helix transcriptional regulator [Pirellulales bacterium]